MQLKIFAGLTQHNKAQHEKICSICFLFQGYLIICRSCQNLQERVNKHYGHDQVPLVWCKHSVKVLHLSLLIKTIVQCCKLLICCVYEVKSYIDILELGILASPDIFTIIPLKRYCAWVGGWWVSEQKISLQQLN